MIPPDQAWQKSTFLSQFKRLIGEEVPRDRAKFMAEQYAGVRSEQGATWLKETGI